MNLNNLYYESVSNNEIILWYYDEDIKDNIGVTLFSDTGNFNCERGVQILQEYIKKVREVNNPLS